MTKSKKTKLALAIISLIIIINIVASDNDNLEQDQTETEFSNRSTIEDIYFSTQTIKNNVSTESTHTYESNNQKDIIISSFRNSNSNLVLNQLNDQINESLSHNKDNENEFTSEKTSNIEELKAVNRSEIDNSNLSFNKPNEESSETVLNDEKNILNLDSSDCQSTTLDNEDHMIKLSYFNFYFYEHQFQSLNQTRIVNNLKQFYYQAEELLLNLSETFLDSTHLKETFLTSLLIIILGISTRLSYTLLRRQKNKRSSEIFQFNKKIRSIEINLNNITLKKKILDNEYRTLTEKCSDYETRLNDNQQKLKESNETLDQLVQTNNLNQAEIKKLKLKENQLIRDLNLAKVELTMSKENEQNRLNEYEVKLKDYEMKIDRLNNELKNKKDELELTMNECNYLNLEITKLKENEIKSNQNLDAKESLIQALKQTDKSSDEKANLDEISNAYKLEIMKLEQRIQEMEKLNRDQDIKIKLLNELREKDTIQHLKAMNELDLQLRKKICEVDKLGHLFDQLKIKQEKIEELELQLERNERKANHERQQFEKQTHENWLQARKVEKDFKDAKNEINLLKNKCLELESLNKNLNENYNQMKQSISNQYLSPISNMQQNQQAPTSQQQFNNKTHKGELLLKEVSSERGQMNETKLDQSFNLDSLTVNVQSSSPSIYATNTSGVPFHPTMFPPFMIKPPYVNGASMYRYPFPLPSPK